LGAITGADIDFDRQGVLADTASGEQFANIFMTDSSFNHVVHLFALACDLFTEF
jgi:hypothetical protein